METWLRFLSLTFFRSSQGVSQIQYPGKKVRELTFFDPLEYKGGLLQSSDHSSGFKPQFPSVLIASCYLKVLSSEMDPAEIRLIR